MYKYLCVFLLPLLVCFAGNAKASSLDYEIKMEEVKQQRQSLQAEINSSKDGLVGIEDEAARQPIINNIIQLIRQDNKLAAYEQAYANALGIDPALNFYAAASTYHKKVDMSPGEVVPASYIPLYKAAGAKYGIEWTLLAAIHKVETDYSRIKSMVSSAGALGHMQFMPATFSAYGVDGNRNGVTSPWEIEDAVYSAANYLAASGYSRDIKKAIWHYNHAGWYVELVIKKAEQIRRAL